MTQKILLVDDDVNLLSACERNFHGRFQIETAAGAEAGLKKLGEQGPYAVVVSDRQMPGMDGIKFLSLVREREPDTVRMMLTGNADLAGAIKVVNEGAIFRFLTKPCPIDVLGKMLEDGLTQFRLISAEKELLNKTLNGSIKLLTDILSMMEPESFGRAQALREVIATIAKKFNMADEWEIQLAAMVAPIGNVTLPADVLVRARKGEMLSKLESQLVGNVPETAARLLANIPRLQGVANIVRYQNKNFDGTGYPVDSVKGDAIPLGARLLKILADFSKLQDEGQTRAGALFQMGTLTGHYDLHLLAAVKHFYTDSAAQLVGHSDLPIAISDLAPGMVLRSNIETLDGMLVLCAGHHCSEMTIEKIKNFERIGGIKQPIFVAMPSLSAETPAP